MNTFPFTIMIVMFAVVPGCDVVNQPPVNPSTISPVANHKVDSNPTPETDSHGSKTVIGNDTSDAAIAELRTRVQNSAHDLDNEYREKSNLLPNLSPDEFVKVVQKYNAFTQLVEEFQKAPDNQIRSLSEKIDKAILDVRQEIN